MRFHRLKNPPLYKHPNVKYTFKKKIGDGSASKIYICENKETKKEYVIKRIHKNEEWKAELDILKLLKNAKKLLNFEDFYISDRYVYIITKFYTGCDLFDHIDINVPFSEEYTKQLFKEMSLCVKECHDLGIAHLDIKCENFMVKSMEPPELVLIDFGHSEKISLTEMKKGYTKYGTCFYLCPEGYTNYYSMKSDTWSLGICLHLFLTGDYPFEEDNRYYEKNVLHNELKLSNKNISPEAKELILGCLDPDPKTRYSVQNILESSFLL
jgi:serine/threonine protein kinase